MKEWFKKRQKLSNENFVEEIRNKLTRQLYTNFLRMGVLTYSDLLQTVAPFIEKEDTVMRNAIPARQRLSATLGF
jgi:hypothetical protein